MAALYTSLSIMTALREANQVGSLQPTTLVSYEADIERVFDARDEVALPSRGMTANDLAAPTWRDEMKKSGEALTQAFARKLHDEGYRGLLVRSFAPGAGAADFNLVLWAWGATKPARLTLVDDEGRLG